MNVENLNNKATLVTALYHHSHDEIIGGRNWDLDFFAPPFRNILNLELPIVVYTHEKVYDSLVKFFNKYAKTEYKIIKQDLTEFKYSDKILALKEKTGNFENGRVKPNKHILNDRNTHLCLSKIYWLKEASENNFFKSNKFYWIDAGLFHHGIFPEKFGGMERFTKKYLESKYYYPEFTESIFNTAMGNYLSNKVSKFLALVHKEMPINARIAKILEHEFNKIGYIVGGLFGGPKNFIDIVHKDFDFGLQKVLDNNTLVLEEDLLSCVSAFNREAYEVIKFEQWHHDIEGEPCYYGASSKHKSFYKIFQNEMQ